MNYFEFYPGDYLRDTSRLRLVQHGAYLRLLLAYYSEERPLPGPHEDLYVIASAITAAEKEAVRSVADQFFPIGEDGQRRKSRVEEEIVKAQRRIERSRQNGAGGGRKKTQQVTHQPPQQDARQLTHSGEASPHATRHTPVVLQTSERTDTPSGATHDMARALQALGYSDCTAGNPYLIKAAEAGVTVAGLQDAAAGKQGKPISYLVKRAIGKLTDAAAAGDSPSRANGVSPELVEAQERCRSIEDQLIDLRHQVETSGALTLAQAAERRTPLLRDLAEARATVARLQP